MRRTDSFLCGLQVGHAQNGVIYRDYDRLGWTILDSLKRPEAASLFKGMNTLKRETRMVQEEALVDVVPHFAGKRKLKPGKMMTERRASVLMMFKYLRATTRPEAIEPWATAVVLSEDGVVTNWHVFWQLIDPTARLDLRDNTFVATEAGKIYSISSILSYSRSGDLAFFKIDTRGDRLVPMPIGGDLAVGENVHALTNPAGYPYVYTNGVVSRTFIKESGNPFANRVEITADFAKGTSGGPIMDDRGNMVAMVSCLHPIFYVDQPPTDRQMGIKECIPVSSIVRLMHQ
ncbi:MAG: serine protease [Butyricimonas faecalis]